MKPYKNIRGNELWFKYASGPYGWLSNFSPYPIKINGHTFPTTEHLYQAWKIKDRQPVLINSIKQCSTPKAAKLLVLENKEFWLREWDEIKYDVMTNIISLKVEQHPKIADALKDTGDLIIIEDNPRDYYWGIGDGSGRNNLGQIWMNQRNLLK